MLSTQDWPRMNTDTAWSVGAGRSFTAEVAEDAEVPLFLPPDLRALDLWSFWSLERGCSALILRVLRDLRGKMKLSDESYQIHGASRARNNVGRHQPPEVVPKIQNKLTSGRAP